MKELISQETISDNEIKVLSMLIDKKYNIMTLTELHGFLTAILSSPRLIMPSIWLPNIIHDEDGNVVFDDEDEMQEFTSLLLRFYNSVIQQFGLEEDFKIISFKKCKYIEIKNATDKEIEFWCTSYISGTYCANWDNNDSIAMLMPIAALAKEFDIKALNKELDNDIDYLAKFKEELSDIIHFIHDMHTGERSAKQPKPSKINKINKIGRNQNCPCGSELKFKKCCGSQNMMYH